MKSHLKRRNKSLGSVEAALEGANKADAITAALITRLSSKDTGT